MNKEFIKETIDTIVFVLVALIIIRFFVCEVRWIPSASMKPTLIEGDRVFVERFSRFYQTPQRGDIMVFYPPETKLKIEIKQNPDGAFDVLINDKAIQEPYIMNRFEYPMCSETMFCGPMVLGEDEYFMMGDNRGHSADSRYWGVLNKKRFIGRAKILFWPFTRIHYFEKKEYN